MTTLLEFRTESRNRADMNNSQFITNSELNSYINQSIYELYDLLVGASADYYLSELMTTVASGASTIAIPADFYKLRGLDYYNNGNWQTLRKFNFENRNQYNNTNLVNRLFSSGIQYRVMGSNILLTPQNSAAGQYRLYYIPKFEPLVLDTDSFDGINGFEEYVIVDAAIKMLQKEESDVSIFVMQKQKLLDRIQAMASERDHSEPEHIADTNDIGNGW